MKIKTNSKYVKENDIFVMTSKDVVGTKEKVSLKYKQLVSAVKVGDRIYIETGYGSYVYEVYETVIFSISDYHYVMNYDEGEKLTLYTCHPRGTAYRTERYGVICKKISGPEWIKID